MALLIMAIAMVLTGCSTSGQTATGAGDSTGSSPSGSAGPATSAANSPPPSSAATTSAPGTVSTSAPGAVSTSPPGAATTSCIGAVGDRHPAAGAGDSSSRRVRRQRPVMLVRRPPGGAAARHLLVGRSRLHGHGAGAAGHRSVRVRHRLRRRRPRIGAAVGRRGCGASSTRCWPTTGAEQVDVIGFSQGGLLLRTALRLDGLAPKVATAVLIAPSFHGSTSPLLTALPAGSARPAPTRPPALRCSPSWPPAATWTARCATPWSPAPTTRSSPRLPAQVPLGPADRVQSILVQDRCPDEVVDHVSLPRRPGRHRLDRRCADHRRCAGPEPP